LWRPLGYGLFQWFAEQMKGVAPYEIHNRTTRDSEPAATNLAGRASARPSVRPAGAPKGRWNRISLENSQLREFIEYLRRQEANEAIVAELSVLVDASGFVDPEDTNAPLRRPIFARKAKRFRPRLKQVFSMGNTEMRTMLDNFSRIEGTPSRGRPLSVLLFAHVYAVLSQAPYGD